MRTLCCPCTEVDGEAVGPAERPLEDDGPVGAVHAGPLYAWHRTPVAPEHPAEDESLSSS